MSTVKPVEIKATQYYLHRSYVPSYYWVYVFLEQWIAAAVFRNDTSRVFMASNAYAFRRRFELTDMSKDYDQLEVSSLRFPFANYNPLNTGWAADTRPAANTAAMVYLGIQEGLTKVKASAVYQDIPVVFYFDREDDARLAYDRLFFYTYNEHYYSMDIPFNSMGRYPDGARAAGRSSTLKLPINIILKGVSFNPNFTEADWLNKNRIFTIAATFSCRTYALFPPTQPDYKVNEKNANNLDYDYDDGTENYYIVNDVILNMINDVYNVETYNSIKEFPAEGNTATIYVDSYLEKIPEEITTSPIEGSKNYYRWNNLSKEYELYEPYKSVMNSIRVSGALHENSVDVNRLYIKKVTTSSATVAWTVNNLENLEKIELYLDGLSNKVTLSSTETSYTFKNLTAGSKYNIFINFFAVDGSSTRLQITATTENKNQPGKDLNTLVGMSW